MPTSPKTPHVSERLRNFAAKVYRNSLNLMILSFIWQVALVAVLLFGSLIWGITQLQKVVTTEDAGHAQSAGMQTDGRRGWVQTHTGFYFVRSPVSVGLQEPLILQTRGEGSRYLCSRISGCSLVISD